MTVHCLCCKYWGSDCNPEEEDYQKPCVAFVAVSDKEWAMRNGLWSIEDEINENADK